MSLVDERAAEVLGLLKQGDRSRALVIARELVATFPDEAEAHNALGNALAASGQDVNAAQTYRRAIELRPDLLKAYTNLANLERRMGRLREALELLDEALRLDPSAPRALSARAHVLRVSTRSAIATYEAARAREDAAHPRASLVELYACAGAVGMARAHAARLRELHPNGAPLPAEALLAEPITLQAAEAHPFLPWVHSRFVETAEDEAAFAARFGWAEPVRSDEVDLAETRVVRVGLLTNGAVDPIAPELVTPLLDGLRAEGFEVCVLGSFDADASAADALRARPDFFDVSTCGNKETALVIAERGIDVLVDLVGHGPMSRLRALAYRPAPVQLVVSASGRRCAMPTVDLTLDPSWNVVGAGAGADAPNPKKLARLVRDAWVDWSRGVRRGTRARLGERTVRMNIGDAGFDLFVPGSLSVLSTVVFAERESWFEDEVDALPIVARPGATVLDVGANVGAYTLPLARGVGPDGRVLAVEPARDTAALLERSIVSAGMSQVRIERAALGGREGTARLRHGASPEMNDLSASGEGEGEVVRLTTLTALGETAASATFLKVDAEGSEEEIVREGAAVLRSSQAIVMFEIRHGSDVNLGLLNLLAELGYSLCSFHPGLRAFVPFTPLRPGSKPIVQDAFALNGFAIPKERVEALELGNLLLRALPEGRATLPASVAEVAAFLARKGLAWMPGTFPESLAWFVASESAPDLPRRWLALERSADLALREVGERATLERRLHTARLLRASGRRGAIASILEPVVSTELSDLPTNLAEAFLPAIDDYPGPPAGDSALPRWLLAQAISAYAEYTHWSVYYATPATATLLTRFVSLGVRHPVTLRRFGLHFGRDGSLD